MIASRRRKPAVLAALVAFAGLACKPRQEPSSAALEAETASAVPPVRSFHFGTWRNLQMNQGGISQGAWDGSIATDRYVPFRRGLYVSENPSFNERYVFDDLGNSLDAGAWMMQVILDQDNPACRGKFIPDVRALDRDADFAAWLPTNAKGHASVDAFRRECVAGRSTQADFLAAFGNRDQAETTCGRTVYSYMEARGITVTRDYLWPDEGFWVIHDRSCVKTVLTDPASVLEALASTPAIWSKRPFGGKERDATPKWKMASALFHIMMRALYESQAVDEAVLSKIEAQAQRSDIDQWNVKGVVPQLAATARRCFAEGNPALKGVLAKYVADGRVLRNEITFNEQANQLAVELGRLPCGAFTSGATDFDTRTNWARIMREAMRRAGGNSVTDYLGGGRSVKCYMKYLFRKEDIARMEPDDSLEMTLRSTGSGYRATDKSGASESVFAFKGRGTVQRDIVLSKPLSASVTARIITGQVSFRMLSKNLLVAEITSGIIGGKVKAGQRPLDVPTYYPSVLEQGETLEDWQEEVARIPLAEVIIDPRTKVDPSNPVIRANRYVATAYGICKDPEGFKAEAFYDLLDQIKLSVMRASGSL